MNRNLVRHQQAESNGDGVLRSNLSKLFRLEIANHFGDFILDFSEDFLLSKEDFDDVPDNELNNILARLSTRRTMLTSAIHFGHQQTHQVELQFKEVESRAIIKARKIIEDGKIQQFMDGVISKTAVTVTNSEISSLIYSQSEDKEELLNLTDRIQSLKDDTRFLEMFDKMIESRTMILLHLSKKRSGGAE